MDAARGDRENAGTGWGAKLGVLGLAALLCPCGPLLPGPARALEARDIFQARPRRAGPGTRRDPSRLSIGTAYGGSGRDRAALRVALAWTAGGWRLGGSLRRWAPSLGGLDLGAIRVCDKELSISRNLRGVRGQIDFRLRPGGVREGWLRLVLTVPPRPPEAISDRQP